MKLKHEMKLEHEMKLKHEIKFELVDILPNVSFTTKMKWNMIVTNKMLNKS